MEPPDLELLERIAAGEPEAMHHFYERFYSRLHYFLRSRLHGNRALVDDALQEVFLNIWRSAGSFRNQSSVATWVFQIAHHQALRSLRVTLTTSSGRERETGSCNHRRALPHVTGNGLAGKCGD
jgi:RNA polymerase sigma factor (sigma-70 family)